MKAFQIYLILSTLPILSNVFSHNRLSFDPEPSAELTVEAGSKTSPSSDEAKILSSTNTKKELPSIERRALALARAHNIQSVSELRSFYLGLNRKFVRGYPFPDQPDLRRMVDWDATVANVENENLLKFYERILGDEIEVEGFIARLKN